MICLRAILVVCVLFAEFQFAYCRRQILALEVEDLLSAVSIARRVPVDLSPDGKWVAFTTQTPRRRQPVSDSRSRFITRTGAAPEALGCDIWVTKVATGETRNITNGQGTSYGPVWSPDGKFLAYYTDKTGLARLWIWDVSTGQSRQISNQVVRQFLNFEVAKWSPEGQKILTKILPENLTIEDLIDITVGPKPIAADIGNETSSVLVYRSRPSVEAKLNEARGTVKTVSSLNRDLCDLALIDVRTGDVQRIARNVRARWFWFSPNGLDIAYTNLKGLIDNTQQMVFDIAVMSLQRRKTSVVASDVPLVPYGISVSWSPDGEFLSYTTAGPQAGSGGCFIVSVTSKRTFSVAPPHPNFAADYRAPLWDSSGRFLYLLAEDKIWKVNTHTAKAVPLASITGRQIVEIISPASGGRFWSPDGRSMYVNTRDERTKKAGFYLIDLTTGKSSQIVEESKNYGGVFMTDVSDDGHTLIYAAEDAQNESNLWVAQGHLQNRRQLTHINSRLARYTFGKTRLVEWKSADGKSLQGALLLPPQYEPTKKYPLIVRLYGGSSLSNSLNTFGLENGGDNMQLFATRGYAVFFPDTPLPNGTPQRDLFKTVIPGIDRVIELGIADPDRLGIMGHSYGGYSTLALIVQTSRFKAAMASASVGNLFTIYSLMEKDGGSGGIGWAERGQGRMGGTPWNMRSRYIENSPFFYLDKVVTPLLLIHGGLDRPVLAEEVFVGLRRLGKEVVYARYEGEGHTPASWSYLNRKDYLRRTIEWFDNHLKASP